MDLREIAITEEQRMARGYALVADEWRALGGGVAARGPRGTWVNSMMGVGVAEPIANGALDEAVAWYEGAGLTPQIVLCPYSDPALLDQCAQLGFTLEGFETVFVRRLERGEDVRPAQAPPSRLEIRRVDAGDAIEVRQCALLIAADGDAEGADEAAVDVMSRCMRAPDVVMLMAWLDGCAVAASAVHLAGETCALFGQNVLPAYRRRGIQQAMIAARLRLAIENGARLATMMTRPPNPTERNALRMGFQVAYTKVVLERRG